MSNENRYDVVVIGAGPVGENVASTVTEGGLTAAIVESELVGGECSYWACIPSKALLRPAAARDAALAVDGAKQAVTGDLDAAAVLARRDGFVSRWDDTGQAGWLDSAGIPLVRGTGRLSGDREVTVATPDGGEVVLHAAHAVAVATGSAAVVPDLPGLREARPWTNREATGAEEVPRRLVVIGGGVVGCEMADAFQGLGSQVTMLVRGDRLLAGVPAFAGRLVADAFTARGVDVRLGTSASAVERRADGTVAVTVPGGTVEADEILVATGRRPRTEGIGLDAVGLRDGDWVEVSDDGRATGVPGGWLYAVGDVNHRALLTHMGKYQARAAGAAILARAAGRDADGTAWNDQVATADHTAVPQVVFTRPEVASVGRTAEQARDAGLDVRTTDYELGDTAGGALHADGYVGHAQLVIDAARDVVVGATFAGPDVADLLHAATIAVVGEVRLARLWHAVPSFPTTSEIWLRLLETDRAATRTT